MGILAVPYEKDTVGIRTPFHWRNATPPHLLLGGFLLAVAHPPSTTLDL